MIISRKIKRDHHLSVEELGKSNKQIFVNRYDDETLRKQGMIDGRLAIR